MRVILCGAGTYVMSCSTLIKHQHLQREPCFTLLLFCMFCSNQVLTVCLQVYTASSTKPTTRKKKEANTVFSEQSPWALKPNAWWQSYISMTQTVRSRFSSVSIIKPYHYASFCVEDRKSFSVCSFFSLLFVLSVDFIFIISLSRCGNSQHVDHKTKEDAKDT